MMPIRTPVPSAPAGRPSVFAQTFGVPRKGTLEALVGRRGAFHGFGEGDGRRRIRELDHDLNEPVVRDDGVLEPGDPGSLPGRLEIDGA